MIPRLDRSKVIQAVGIAVLISSFAGQAFAGPAELANDYGKLPMRFESAANLSDGRNAYVARGTGFAIRVDRMGAKLALGRRGKKGNLTDTILGFSFLGANPASEPRVTDPLPGVSNYFTGKDPSKWRTGVRQYERILQQNIYPGIDMVYYGKDGKLEYDLVVRNYSSLPKVLVRFDGGARLSVNEGGDLNIAVGDREKIIQHRPELYQEIGGHRRHVDGRYVIKGDNLFGFEATGFNPRKPLVIDPVLTYSSFLGGSGFDEMVSIAVDAGGNAYVAGWSNSTNFPVSTGAYQSAARGGSNYGDAVVTKVDPTGKTVLYSTYIGGSGDDTGWAVAVDNAGNAYLAGYTQSADFPVTAGAFQTTLRGSTGGFLSKLNATGTALVYSTYLSGNSNDKALAVAVDSAGQAFVAGGTNSIDFPVTLSAAQPNLAGAFDAFALKLNSAGTALAYSTFVGGANDDNANGIAIDASGNAYITGGTQSKNYPITAGVVQPIFAGGLADAFVTKINSTGTGFVYSTYLGGSQDEYSRALVVDGSGYAYVAGRTASPNFPTTSGAYQTALAGNFDAYVSKVKPDGSGFAYSTLIGGAALDQAEGIGVDAEGRAHIAVITQSSNYPVTIDAFQSSRGQASYSGAATILNAAGSALSYSTFIGGNNSDGATSATVDGAGNTYITGSAQSVDFPVTPGAFQTAYGGGAGDAFIAKFDACYYSATPSSLSLPAAAGTGTFTVSATANCAWTGISRASWITVTSGASGAGNGTVAISVTANTGGARSGTLTIAGQTVTVNQAAACTYSLSPSSQTFALAGGTGSVNLAASAGCSWTAASDSPWLTVTGGASGTGNGTITYSIASSTTARTATITIAGIAFTVSQTGSSVFTPIRVRAGGQAYTDQLGQVWAADNSYSGGGTYSSSTPVFVTTEPGLYQSERYGNSQLTYQFSLPNGSYTVKLKFAEIYFTQSRQRVFNVSINGTAVLTNFDLVATAGYNTAVDRAFTIPVTNGQLAILFASVVENPKISAIEIVSSTGVGLAVTPANLNISAGQSQAFTPSVTGTSNSSIAWTMYPSVGSMSGNVFTAPASVSGDQYLTLAATSLADTTQSQNIIVKVSPAASCSYTLSPSSSSLPAAGGNGSFSITANTGCAWTVSSNAPWLTLTGAVSGSGNGVVSYTAAANSGPSRSGTLTAAGSVFTVSQAGNCNFVLSVPSQDLTLTGGTSSVTVTAGAGCAWTAVSSSSWITVTSGAAGNGNGTVTFAAAAASVNRSGTIAIAGITFAVNEIGSSPIRINAGGRQYTDSQGNIWQADTNFSGGQTFSRNTGIAKTNDPTLYQSERYNSGSFLYQFPITNGSHTVTLKFAEIYFTQPGQRVFNIVINGQTVLSNFDIDGQAGPNSALDKIFQVNVTSKLITIQFVGVLENPKVSALEIQ